MTEKIDPLTQAEIDELMAEHDKGGAFKAAPVAQGCWDAGIEILSSCGHMTIPKFHIFIEPLADQKIKKLQSYYSSLEWLMYLVGNVDHEAKTVTVTDLVLPDSQQVTGVNVHNVEYTWPVLPDGNKICGVIHSHHNMGAFFSGTDDAYINQNHDVSIVVATNPNSPIKGQVRTKTPCDAYVLSENVTFSIKYPQVLDEAAFEAEFTKNIHTYKPVIYTYPQNYRQRGMGNFSRGSSANRGRGYSNPDRTSQHIASHGQMNLLGYDTEDENEFPDPYKMTEADLRDHLLDYYSPEEVEEFAVNCEMAEELNMVQELCKEGYDISRSSLSYDVNRDVNAQTGRSQVASGVALRDQMGDETNVWEVEEDELNFTFDAEEDGDEIITLDVEHGENGVIVKDRQNLH
jgi:hypothetical protein